MSPCRFFQAFAAVVVTKNSCRKFLLVLISMATMVDWVMEYNYSKENLTESKNKALKEASWVL